MTITLTPEQETILNRKVASGQFASVTEAVSAALRLLEEQDLEDSLSPEEMRHAIALGDAAYERGQQKTFMAADLKRQAREALVQAQTL